MKLRERLDLVTMHLAQHPDARYCGMSRVTKGIIVRAAAFLARAA